MHISWRGGASRPDAATGVGAPAAGDDLAAAAGGGGGGGGGDGGMHNRTGGGGGGDGGARHRMRMKWTEPERAVVDAGVAAGRANHAIATALVDRCAPPPPDSTMYSPAAAAAPAHTACAPSARTVVARRPRAPQSPRACVCVYAHASGASETRLTCALRSGFVRRTPSAVAQAAWAARTRAGHAGRAVA